MTDIAVQILLLMLFTVVRAIDFKEEEHINEATVEILIVVEKNLSDEFNNSDHRRSYFCKLFKQVENIYDKIQGIKLNIAIKGLKIVKKLEDQPFLENHFVIYEYERLLNESSFYAFQDFAEIQGWIREYDAVFLLTRAELTDGISPIVGLSYTSGICKEGENIGVVIPESSTIAHELAHMLGVQDDDFYYTHKKTPFYSFCSDWEGYIMGSLTDSKTEKNLQFSMCSAEMLRCYLNSNLYSCLRKDDATDTVMCNRDEHCKEFCVPATPAMLKNEKARSTSNKR